MSNGVEVSDPAVGALDANRKIGLFSRHAELHRRFEHRQVFGDDSITRRFEGDLRSGIDSEDSAHLLRPDVLVLCSIPREAAGLTQSLGLDELTLRPPQLDLGTLEI